MRVRIFCYEPQNAIRGKVVVIDDDDNRTSLQFVSQFSLRLILRLLLNSYRNIEIILANNCSQKVHEIVNELLSEYGRNLGEIKEG